MSYNNQLNGDSYFQNESSLESGVYYLYDFNAEKREALKQFVETNIQRIKDLEREEYYVLNKLSKGLDRLSEKKRGAYALDNSLINELLDKMSDELKKVGVDASSSNYLTIIITIEFILKNFPNVRDTNN